MNLSSFRACWWMVCLGAILALELRAADVRAQGRELRVNDRPFLMRGVCIK